MTESERVLVDTRDLGPVDVLRLKNVVRRLDAENERQAKLMREAAELMRDCARRYLGDRAPLLAMADRLDGKA